MAKERQYTRVNRALAQMTDKEVMAVVVEATTQYLVRRLVSVTRGPWDGSKTANNILNYYERAIDKSEATLEMEGHKQ